MGNAQEKLDAFVMQGRRLATQHGLNFDDQNWEVSLRLGPCEGRPRMRHNRRLDFTRGKERSGGQPMPKQVALLAKAFIAHFLGRTQMTALTDRLDAFRHLGAQLADKPVTASTMETFDAAASTLKAHYSPDAARHRACQLEFIAEFLGRHGMVRTDLSNWAHRSAGSILPAGTSGSEFSANAAARLPAPDFLVAIARAFACAVKPADVLVTGACTLLRCFPGRISAVLNLQEYPSQDHCDNGDRRLLVHLPGDKRIGPSVRWVSKELTPLVEMTLGRMHDVTAGPRAAKCWYERHPHDLYLPGALRRFRRRETLTANEAAALLGITPSHFPEYARRKGLKTLRLGKGPVTIAFSIVESYIVSHTNSLMRAAGGIGYRPLMLLPWNGLKSTVGGSPCMFDPLRYEAVKRSLMPPPGEAGLFERLGIAPRGSIVGNSHSFRHELTTAAVRGGLSEEDMAEWFGRRDPRWSSYYDHSTNADVRGPLSNVPALFFAEGLNGRAVDAT